MDHPDSAEHNGEFSPFGSGFNSKGEHRASSTPDDEEASPADIEQCLRLLDEVWPRDDATAGYVPRQLGRFKILGELGRGGFGVVFLAEDSLLGRRVALKVPRVEILTGSESWRRFLREVRAASRLDHPNLVPLLEAGAVGPVGYIVSAYVAGPSLEQWLRSRPEAARPRWAASLVAALARGIVHVHGQNILHRDLKPANVLLYAPGRPLEPADPSAWEGVPFESWVPRICDFGLAKLYEIEEEETRSRVVCGSPPYMAPEQADSRRDEIGPATDVYGLGTILYELLTGRPPFGGKSNLEILRRVVTEEPMPPRKRRPVIPRDLETICLKCLAKRPERRYATAADLAADLERILEGRTISARPTPALERAGRWARRNPAAAVLASTVMLAFLAGSCGLLWHDAVLRAKNDELRREAQRAERHAQDADVQRNLADRQARLLRRQPAGSRLFQTQQAILAGNFEAARRLLEDAAPEFGTPAASTFAWRYLVESVRDHVEVLSGHQGMVDCLAISPDGWILATGDDRGEIPLWDLEGGRCRMALSGSHHAIGRLAWSCDGTALASADRHSGEIRIWVVSSGRCRGRLEGTGAGEPIWALSFEDEGRRIRASGPRHDPGRSPTRFWDINGSGDVFPEALPRAGAATSANPPDHRLQELVRVLDGVGPSGAPGVEPVAGGTVSPSPADVAFTRDQKLGIVARGRDVFEVIRNRSWTQLATLYLRPGHEVVVLISPKINRGVSPPAERKRIELFARALDPVVRKKPPFPGSPRQVSEWWSSTSGPYAGQLLLWHESFKRLELLSLETGEEVSVSELGPLTGVQAMALGPDGATLGVGTEAHQIRMWHRRQAPRVISTSGHSPAEAWTVAFAPDGRTLASGGDDHRIRLWDAATGREKATLRKHAALVSSLAFSPDGRTLATGSFDLANQGMLWDVGSGTPLRLLRGHDGIVRCVAFSPDGLTLASSGDHHSVLLWDPNDGRQKAAIAVEPARGPGYLTFSPDGQTIATSGTNGFHLVDMATGRIRSIPVGEEVGSLRFSHDGALFQVALRDGSIGMWDLKELRQVRKFQGHAGLVLDLALSPDGATLALACADKIVRIWDIATGQELLCLTECRARVNSVAFSRDGQKLAATDHAGGVTIWDASPRH
jgi:WD40 repeat protein